MQKTSGGCFWQEKAHLFSYLQTYYVVYQSQSFVFRFMRYIIWENETFNHNWDYFLMLANRFYRSSHRRCSARKGALRNSQNSQENTCARVSFFNKIAGLRAATLLKKRLWHRCFLMNSENFLRTPFLQNTYGRLLLVLFLNYLRRSL